MSGIVAFDDLFPLKPNPSNLDRVFGFDSGDGKSRGFTIQSILDLIADTPVTWGEITGKPPVFPAEAHTIGSHSNVASSVDSAGDGTFLKKVGGQVQAVAVDFYGVSNPPPPDPSVPEAARLITALKTAQWDQAYGWGNHAGQYRPISYVPSWAEITSKPPTFAPSAHTLVSHSDAAALATATEGQLVRKAAVGFEAFTADYYSPFNPPPPDASIPDFVRDFTIGQFAGYEAKMLEFTGLPDGAVPLIKDGVPADSQLMGIYSENPFDPETEEEDYDAFVAELLHLISTKRIKGPDAEDADDYATLGQVPVLFEDDLAAIAAANVPSGLNPFATMGDLFSKSVFDLLQSGATDGQAIVWSDANNRYEPGTVAGGGGADTNAVHYNAADGKTASEQNQARDNIFSTSSTPQIETGTGTINDLARTSNCIFFTGSGAVNLAGLAAGRDGEECVLVNLTGNILTLKFSSLSAAANKFQLTEDYVFQDQDYCVVKYSSSLTKWLVPFRSRFIGTSGNSTKTALNNTSANVLMRFEQLNLSGILEILGDRVKIYKLLEFLSATTLTTLTGASPGNSLFYWNSGSSAPFILAQNGVSYFGANGGQMQTVRELSFRATWGGTENGRFTPSNGRFFHARSGAANESIRRDEKRLYEVVTVTTAGAINNQVLTAGIFNYRFTACTSLTGLVAFEIGDKITIHNDNTVDLVFEHENAGSIAANRNNVIGAASLNVPTKGKIEIIYCTGSRWELVSKNF